VAAEIPLPAHALHRLRATAVWLALLMIAACGGPDRVRREPEPPPRPAFALPTMRYAVQAGAFRNVDNAVRLTTRLLDRNLMAYHFIDESGFYKVRIGNYPSREEAVAAAERLKAEHVIEEYFIVAPGDYAVAQAGGAAGPLRRELVRTAERFVGTPYKWGGDTSVDGFDCSGLTMTVYRLNGLNLPRTSGDQWQAGRSVELRDLAEGDLVFFATRAAGKVSHVGIYVGGDNFLHAPRRGSQIQLASLSSDYYRARYLGARAYF